MKIEVYFRDQKLGTGTSNGDKVQWEGEGARRIAMIAGFYEDQGFHGDELLQEMVNRLNGNIWAQEVGDDQIR